MPHNSKLVAASGHNGGQLGDHSSHVVLNSKEILTLLIVYNMPPLHRQRNRLRIVSYYCDTFRGRRTQISEVNFAEPQEEEEEDNWHTFSMTELYHQWNSTARPQIHHRQVDSQVVMETSDNGDEREEMLERGTLHAATFTPTAGFHRALVRFQDTLSVSFPNVPCAYCGVLSLPWTTCWLAANEAAEEVDQFGLRNVLNLPLHIDQWG